MLHKQLSVQVLLFWDFLEFYPQTQNIQIWRANCLFFHYQQNLRLHNKPRSVKESNFLYMQIVVSILTATCGERAPLIPENLSKETEFS